MRIVVDDLSGPEIADFLAAHVEEMKAVTRPAARLDPILLSALGSASIR